MKFLFANPRNVLRLEDAMISMLAGQAVRRTGAQWTARLRGGGAAGGPA